MSDEETHGDGADSSNATPEAVRAESVDNNPGYANPHVNYAPYPGTYTPYQQASSPYPPGYQRPVYKRTNGLAVAGFVISLSQLFLFFGITGVVAVIFSHIGLYQINKLNEAGRGLAITGLILGYLGIVLFILFMFLIFGSLFSDSGGDSSTYDT